MSEETRFWLLAGMFVVLVALALFVIYAVGRFVLAIGQGWLEDRKPRKSVVVEDLGAFTSGGPKNTLWSGQLPGEKLALYIGGTSEAPDPTLVANLKDALQNLAYLRDAAFDLILQSSEMQSFGLSPVREKLAVEALDFLWPEHPGRMGMEIGHADDSNGVLRVDFENKKPLAVGYDD